MVTLGTRQVWREGSLGRVGDQSAALGSQQEILKLNEERVRGTGFLRTAPPFADPS